MDITSDNDLGNCYIKVQPDFKVIKSYLFEDMPTKDYKKEVKAYNTFGAISLPFLTVKEGKNFSENLNSILDREDLIPHQSNLAFITVYLYSKIRQNLQDTYMPAYSSTKRAKEFIKNMSALIKHQSKDFKISIVEQTDIPKERKVTKRASQDKTEKPIRLTFNDKDTSG